jgi:hypothetical protein
MKLAIIAAVLVLVVLGGYQLVRNHYDDAWRATTRPIQPSENLSAGKPYTDEQLRHASEYMRSIEQRRKWEDAEGATKPYPQ